MARTRTLGELGEGDLRGRTALVRVDYNVPLTAAGKVADPARVDATLPTLRHLLGAGARALLVSHLGRPDGEPDSAFSLAPVARLLGERLGQPVPLLEMAPGEPELATRIGELAEGRAALLENIRFHPGETKNDPALAEALGALGDLFVGDAFGAAHRAHASTVGAAEVVRRRGGPVVAGFLMERELRYLGEALRDPERPFVAVMGGAKISGKIDLIEAILPRVDRLLMGGAMANTFFRAMGLEIGESLEEPDRVEMAARLLEEAGEKLILPVDCVVADAIEEGARTREADRGEVAAGERIGDIGPRSRKVFEEEIASARTLLWNGPMGVFELAPFAEGTIEVARALARAAEAGATVVVGGGDSASAAEVAGVAGKMSHVSTGGGASLDLLAGKPLPGVEVLDRREEE